MPDTNEEIMKPLGLVAVVLILPLAYVMSLGFERFIYPDHGNVAAISIGVALAALYQSVPVLKYRRAVLFLVADIALNIVIPMVGGTRNENFPLLIGLPWALLDYAAFVFGMYHVVGSNR